MLTDRETFYGVSDKIIALSKETGNDSMLIEAYMSRAMVYFLSRDYHSALKYYDTVQISAPADSREFLEAQIGAADIFPKLNYPDSTVTEKHLAIIKQILPTNDSLLIASEFSNFGNYLIDKAGYYDGIQYLIQSIDYTPKHMTFNRVMNQVKLAKLFLYVQDIDKAEYYLLQAKKLADSKNYQVTGKSLALLQGRIALKQRKFVLADSLLKTALFNFKKAGARSDVFISYLSLAELALAQNQHVITRVYLDSAAVFKRFNIESYNQGKFFLLNATLHLNQKHLNLASEDLDSIELLKAKTENIFLDSDYLLLRSELAEAQQQYRKSLLYFQQYKELQDSLFKFKTTGKIYDLESKYQNREKQKEIELISVKLEHERWLKSAFLIFAVISLLFLSFLGITYFKVKAKNQLIRKTATQKDILLKEIHHRVKNNLQLISSLLNLQSRYIKDEKAKQVSMEGKTRVRAMSLIHQFLYQKDELTHLSLDEYFRKLVKELLDIYHISGNDVKVVFNIDQIELDVDRVIPLGLIFNELMTNVFKYAFPEGRKGEIVINLYKKENQLVMEVIDDGVGFETKEFTEKNESFGFTLIEALLSKWKGKLQVTSENGTQARILIPEMSPQSKDKTR